MAAFFGATRAVDFDGLYRHHAASVYRYARAVLGNHADAEDVTQQTFLNAYRAVMKGTKPRKAENWLLRIAHNEVRKHFRSNQKKRLEVELSEQLPERTPERSEPTLADVLRALQHLSPTQRSALVMREFEGRSYAEIAEIMEMSQSALEAQIFRARRALAEQLEGDLTCAEAEEVLLRRLDGRLPRRVSRRLKSHLQDCSVCTRFGDVQKRQRALLKGLSVMPVPASVFLFRGEQAAAAAAGSGAVAAGGSAAVGGTGLAAGVAAKVAAVTAAAAVAGGVGYDVANGPDRVAPADHTAARPTAVAKPRQFRPVARVQATRPVRAQPSKVSVAPSRARMKAAKKSKRVPAERAAGSENVGRGLGHTRDKVSPPGGPRSNGRGAVKPHPSARAPKSRTRPAAAKSVGRARVDRPNPPRPAPAAEKPRNPRAAEPAKAQKPEEQPRPKGPEPPAKE